MTYWIRVLAVTSTMLAAACGDSAETTSTTPSPGDSRYDATVTRTTMGIPHITAADFGSLGYGYGYVFAEDNLCVFLEDLVTIRGERSRYFGPDGSYPIRSNSTNTNNVDSDFFWKLMATEAVVDNLRSTASDDVRAATAGYVAGVNRYIRELQAGAHPGRHAACNDAEWLQLLTEDDLYRRYYRLSVIASASALSTEIATAQPPVLSAGKQQTMSEASAAQALQAALPQLDRSTLPYPFGGPLKFGSNMYALGAEATTTGQSMVFGNPHFPWNGTERFYIVHLTIPGTADIMGASLFGVPAVLIGFNDHLAWSHTVSTAYRFSIYHLSMNPLNPLQYFYEGELRDLEAVPLEIEVLEDDGSLSTQSRTLYRSHYGPMMEMTVSGIPVLGWDNLRGYAIRDANAENDRLLDQFFAWDKAQSLSEFKRLQGEILGIPWVNTVASGPGEGVYYGDVTVVPNVPDNMAADCLPPILGPVVNSLVPGLPFLQGNRADCEWRTDDDAPAPGIFGPSNLPTLERSDWVHNCNDSYWLTHPEEPLTGFARVIGDEEAERSLRTRLCILQIQRRLDASDGRPGTGFDLDTLQDIVLSSQIYSAQLARDTALADLCDDSNTEVCAALTAWDGSDNLDAAGGHVWREFFRGARSASDLWTTPFDVNDPVNTPRDLNTGSSDVQQAFSDAQALIESLGIAADAALGTLQHSGVNDAGGSQIPVFGGEGFEGAFTIASSSTLSENGYPVTFGNSYIQSVTWDANGQVQAEGFLTYSQSTDPANPHYSDFTQAYAAKQWQRLPFSAAAIAEDRIEQYRLTE